MKSFFVVLALAASTFAAASPDILDLGLIPHVTTKAKDPLCPATAVAKAGCVAKFQKIQCPCTTKVAGIELDGKCGHAPVLGPVCVPTVIPSLPEVPVVGSA